MIRKIAIGVMLIGMVMAAPRYVVCGEYESTVDYIQKTGKLWGISACMINAGKSATFVDGKTGYGYALWIPDGKDGALEQVTVKRGEEFELIDGDHVFIMYKLSSLTDGRINVEVTDTFDARSFGGKVQSERIQVWIAPYDDRDDLSGVP